MLFWNEMLTSYWKLTTYKGDVFPPQSGRLSLGYRYTGRIHSSMSTRASYLIFMPCKVLLSSKEPGASATHQDGCSRCWMDHSDRKSASPCSSFPLSLSLLHTHTHAHTHTHTRTHTHMHTPNACCAAMIEGLHRVSGKPLNVNVLRWS